MHGSYQSSNYFPASRLIATDMLHLSGRYNGATIEKLIVQCSEGPDLRAVWITREQRPRVCRSLRYSTVPRQPDHMIRKQSVRQQKRFLKFCVGGVFVAEGGFQCAAGIKRRT